jgi:hypothetical protein
VCEGVEGLKESVLVVVELLLRDGAHVVHAVVVAAPVSDGAHGVKQLDAGAMQQRVSLKRALKTTDSFHVPPDARVIDTQRC